MADNDRFVIQKVGITFCTECKMKKYEVCERDENEFILCPITKETVSETIKKHRGKTRVEYIDIITKILYDTVRNPMVMRLSSPYDAQAKAVVDRLFGEGK